ncbi:hypothetical protein [Micromonospora sp. CPCC 206061]|uniref:hypothetical protein n=1 Tax=Micromonospora sp. CPCC 206061 TaxID=3122410 RepID=UPI002FF2DD4B
MVLPDSGPTRSLQRSQSATLPLASARVGHQHADGEGAGHGGKFERRHGKPHRGTPDRL